MIKQPTVPPMPPVKKSPDPEWYCCRCGQKFFKIRPGAVVKGVQSSVNDVRKS